LLTWHAAASAKTCNVTGGGVAFGSYNPALAARVDTIGHIDIHCDGSFNADISLSVGNGNHATFSGGRLMTRVGQPGTLTYNLYTSATYTRIFGDGTGGSSVVTIHGNKNYSQPVYGRINGGQLSIQAGSYADVIIVTVAY
jgi:spore coat protein U-like protein